MTSICRNYNSVLERIKEACERTGRNPSDVMLVAVSKTVGINEIAEAIVDAGFEVAFKIVTRLFGGDDDCTANCVATIKTALPPLKHFDLLNIEQVLIELRRVYLLYAINNDCDRGLGIAGLCDPADDDEGVTRVLGFNQVYV